MDTNRLFWTISVALVVMAVVQIMYLAWLVYAPANRRRSRQPKAPVMPTSPDNYLNTQPFAYNTAPASEGSIGKIVILNGVPNLTEIPLPSAQFAIGRFYNQEGNILLALDEGSVSRRHATFVSDESTREYYLTDTNSSYGTRIRIGGQMEALVPGRGERIYNEDVVQFGNVVNVRFILPCDTRPARGRLS